MSLQAYLPQDRLRALSRGETLPDRVVGSVLFVDISGFTRLADGLVREFGPRLGAEEIGRQVNRVFDAVIAPVEDYAGSVISFAGDALMCWFDSSGHSEESAPQSALSAAVAMQKAMQSFPDLALKVAVASGPARRFVVGDPQIQLKDVLAGAILDKVAAAEQLAHKGEIILDQATWDYTSRLLIAREWRTGESGIRYAVVELATAPVLAPAAAPSATLPPLHHEVLRGWLLPAVYERLQAGLGDFITELRPAVLLFVKFTGFDYDSEYAGSLLNEYIQWVQRIIRRYDGALLQITMGDKGSYLYAAFGVLSAHENDARRALGAALELRNLPPELGFVSGLQLGISQGTVRTGAYGSSSRCDYGAIGNEANLAARLMQAAAPGEILVSGRVSRAVSPYYEMETRQPIQVKGMTEPVPIFVPIRERLRHAQSAAATSIVGRTMERSRIAECLDQLKAGQDGVLIIEGEAGMGKSRLLADLREQAHLRELPYMIGWADAIETTTAYHAWRPLMAELLQADTLPLEIDFRRELVQARLLELDTTLDPALLPLLNPFLPCDFPETEETQGLGSEGRAHRAQNLFSHLLQVRSKGQPLVIILDDAHWLDSASWGLARLVALDLRPVLFVLATRPMPEPFVAEYRHFLQHPHLSLLQLAHLSPLEIERLICVRLGVDVLPEAISSLVLERGEGNPFFSEELAYVLRDTGLLKIEGPVCSLAPNFESQRINLPDTVQGVIASRIDRLSPQEQLTIKVASVIGRAFAMPALLGVYPVPDDAPRLPDYLGELARLDLTQLEALAPDASYIFKHVTTQEVAYSLLLFAQRRQLHQSLAKWYELTYSAELGLYYPILAHHWQQADEPSIAVRYVALAGEQALQQGAYQETISFLRRALELAARLGNQIDLPTQTRWRYQLSEAYYSIGNWQESRALLLQVVEALGDTQPQEKQIPIRILRELLRQLWRRQTRRDPSRTRAPIERSIHVLASQAYERLSQIAYTNSEKMPTLYAALRHLHQAEEAGAQGLAQQARGYATMTVVFNISGQPRLAQTYADLAGQALAQTDDLDAHAWAETVLGVYHYSQGRWQIANAALDGAMRYAERAGNVRRMEEATIFKAVNTLYQGRFSESRDLNLSLQRMALRQGDPQGEYWAVLWLGRGAFREGQFQQAARLLEHASRLREQLQEAAPPFDILGPQLLLQIRMGDPIAAQTADRLMALIPLTDPTQAYTVEGGKALAEYYCLGWESGRLPGARQALTPILAWLRRVAGIFATSRSIALTYQGWVSQLDGKPAQAQRYFQQAIAAAEEVQMPYEEAQARFLSARFLPATDPARRSQLERAAQIFHKIGAEWDAQQVDALLKAG